MEHVSSRDPGPSDEERFVPRWNGDAVLEVLRCVRQFVVSLLATCKPIWEVDAGNL